MTSFEERLARLAEKNGDAPAPPRSHTQAHAQAVSHAHADEPASPSVAVSVIAVPIGIFLGAIAVLIGGIIEVNFVQQADISLSTIAPPLSFVAFGVALVLSFIMDKVFRGAWTGRIGVTLGFIGMMWGEMELAAMYPKAWMTLYDIQNYSVETLTTLVG